MADKPLENKKKKTGLGRGLDSLFSDTARQMPAVSSFEADAPAAVTTAPSGEALRMVSVADIRPNPDQPRTEFDNEALDELAASIAERGLIQPVVLRPDGRNYQIVAGERRWRAAQRARLHAIPAIVRDFDDAETLEIAIVENVQRRDLNPIEEALAYRRLAGDYGHSQADIARLVGKSRSHVANIMRLADLPEKVRDHLIAGRIQMGHARAMIGYDHAELLADAVAEQGLSVRDVERWVAEDATGDQRDKPKRNAATTNKNPDLAALEEQLGSRLGLNIAIRPGPGGQSGRLIVSYSDLDQLDMLCQRLSGGDF